MHPRPTRRVPVHASAGGGATGAGTRRSVPRETTPAVRLSAYRDGGVSSADGPGYDSNETPSLTRHAAHRRQRPGRRHRAHAAGGGPRALRADRGCRPQPRRNRPASSSSASTGAESRRAPGRRTGRSALYLHQGTTRRTATRRRSARRLLARGPPCPGVPHRPQRSTIDIRSSSGRARRPSPAPAASANSVANGPPPKRTTGPSATRRRAGRAPPT